MTTFVSLLRGVNVGGSKKLKMTELAEAYSLLGLNNVQTYIQTGNVVFSTRISDASAIARKIENQLKKKLGLVTTVIVRDSAELNRIVANNPFERRERTRLHVTFLNAKPENFSTDKVNAVRGNGEEFIFSGKEVYLFLPNGMGRTKLQNNFLEKVLGVTATTRNWNTVTALMDITSAVRQQV